MFLLIFVAFAICQCEFSFIVMANSATKKKKKDENRANSLASIFDFSIIYQF